MKYTTTLFFVLAAVCGFAQPVLNSGDLSPQWDQQYNFSSGFLNAGGGGADVVWNYSTFSGSPAVSYVTVYPQWTAYSKAFSGADYCWSVDGVLLYHNVTSDRWDYMGGVQDGEVIHYGDPETMLHFPFTYGDSFTDSFSSAYSFQGIAYERVGEISVEADGYGALSTPSGTYTDVLRIAMVETFTDSSAVGTSTLEIITYNYYQAGIGQYIVSHGIINYSDSSGETFTFPFNYVLTDVVADVKEQTTSDLRVYPNPTSGTMTVELPEHWTSAKVFLMDMAGRMSLQTQVDKTGVLQLNDLTPGRYTLVAQFEGQTISTQIIKSW
jgi:hypothetical protein